MKNLFKLGFAALAITLSVAACSSNTTEVNNGDSTSVDSLALDTTIVDTIVTDTVAADSAL